MTRISGWIVLALALAPLSASAQPAEAPAAESAGGQAGEIEAYRRASYVGPSVLGFSGYWLTPNAGSLPKGRLNIAFHRVDNLSFQGFAGDRFNSNVYSLHYGVTDRLEVGLSVVEQKTLSDDLDPVGNIKYTILPEKGKGVGVQVGILDLADQLPDGFTPYLLLSKDLGQFYGIPAGRPGALAVGFGVGTGLYDNFFLNFRLPIIRGVQLMAEYGEMSELTFGLQNNHMWSVGARAQLGNGIFFDISALDLEPITIGISWTGRL